MMNMQPILYWLMFCALYSQVEGRVGPVINLQIIAQQYSERSDAVVSWSPPTQLNGNLASELSYVLTYCLLNRPDTCNNKTGLNATANVVIPVDASKQLYQVKVIAVDKNGTTGDVTEKVYTVPDVVTCPTDNFLCSTKQQCVPNNRLCDSIKQCADGSDETSAANCPLPVTPVLWKNGQALTPNSIRVTFYKVVIDSDRLEKYEVHNMNTSITLIISHPQLSPSITELSTDFSGLQQSTTYMFRVRSVNPTGSGQWSDLLQVTTTTVKGKQLACWKKQNEQGNNIQNCSANQDICYATASYQINGTTKTLVKQWEYGCASSNGTVCISTACTAPDSSGNADCKFCCGQDLCNNVTMYMQDANTSDGEQITSMVTLILSIAYLSSVFIFH